MQVINDTNSGGRIGQALANGLQQFAHNKLQHLTNQYNNHQISKGLESLGFTPEESTSISYLDPSIQREIVKQRLAAPSQEAFAQSINELLNPGQSGQQNYQSQIQQPETGLQALQQPMQQLPEFSAADYLSSFPGAATAQRAGLNQQPATQAVNPQLNQPQANMPVINKPKPRLTERQTLELAKLGLQKEKEERKAQKAIQPFLHAEAEDFKAYQKTKSIAKEMLANIEKHEKEWPGPFVGNLPGGIQSFVIRSPYVRKFVADANSLVSAITGTRKGLPSNYKLRLEALSKADLSQPIETQKNLLRSVIKDSEKSEHRQKYINSLQNHKTGYYPEDIERRLIDYSLENSANNFEKLPDPIKLAGKTIKGKTSGKLLKSNGKEWVEVKQ